MMPVLKRVLPFILTLLVGVAFGSLLQRKTQPAAHPVYMEFGAKPSCRMRPPHAILMPLPPPPPSFEGEAFTSKDVTRKAVINYKPEPSYTYDARRNEVTGTVRLRLVLAADGTVRDITPLMTLPDGLTDAAVAAARHIEFAPALKDGEAVSQYVTVEYNFNIY
ncbi:MAG: hypothetical protein QOE47_2503 [Pyrinomonadaceae bacterium]|nr:hypothetical protein [Pyrinomonadaceae bacterium]